MFYIRIKKDKKNQFTEKPPAEETRESVFERRMSEVLARMYRCILSVDLQMNVYRTEMLAECDKENRLRGRGYYDRWVTETRDGLAEEYQKSFGETFSRQNIVKVFDKGRTCLSMICAGKAQEEQEMSWYEFRAEQIPDTVGKRYRCMLYVRQVNDHTDDGRTEERGIRSAAGNGAEERGVRSAGGTVLVE